ncbi:sugar ABC transporter substrate-binding protein [Paenibacillus beijingensis]|uniref:Maltodextrin-binding protein n=1 Tax=Paenibacillus beijingensis TaxID=1126833 RepID=A0A0D5NEY4_9BACL|nr:maltose ABC transporter substrate-binding protein [Paenibacillus beijingensis]AJY73949.1 hypothetical protein VN24_04135 [Paenibacillus beijingensis]
MKKKLALLVLSAVMMLTVAACGGKPQQQAEQQPEQPAANEAEASDELQPEPGAELVLWAGKSAYTEYAAQEFEKKYNIKVKIEEVNSWDSPGRLSTDGPAGTGGDVVEIVSDALGTSVNSGIVLPNDYFEEETRSSMSQLSIDSSTYNGILYGYPRDIYTYALFVNKELVKDTKFETWDDIVAFAKKFNDIPSNKFGFMFDPSHWYLNSSFMLGYGGYIFGKNGTDTSDIGMNNEGAVKGLEFLQTLKATLPFKAADLTGDLKSGLFEQGKVAINFDGSWAASSFRKLPFEVGVIPLPAMPGGQYPLSLIGTHSFYVSAYSKYPNAAKLFANFLTSKEMLAKDYETNGFIPAVKGLEDNEKFKNDEIVQGFMKQLEHSQVMPNVPEMSQYSQVLTPALVSIWDGGNVKQVLDKAADNLKTSIANK